jgi:hypothetical protein
MGKLMRPHLVSLFPSVSFSPAVSCTPLYRSSRTSLALALDFVLRRCSMATSPLTCYVIGADIVVVLLVMKLPES